MKKTHKLKKKVKRVLVKAPPKRKAPPLLESLTEAVLDQLNGGADKATQELRKLTRTKDKTIQSVLAKNAFDTVVGSAFSETRHNEFTNGDAAHQAGKSPVREETKTDSEQKESKPMLVAHTEGGSSSIRIADTNGRGSEEAHDIGTNGSTPKSEVIKRFPGLIGRQPGQKVVHWNVLERNQMARAIVLELMSRGCGQVPIQGDRPGGRLVLDCARAAQLKCLPGDRRRKLTTVAEITTNGVFAQLSDTMKVVQAEREAAQNAEARAKLLGLDKKKPEEPVAPVAPPPVDTSPPPVTSTRTEVPPLSAEELADPILAAANGLILALRVQFREMKEIRQMHALMIEEVDGLRARVEAAETHMRDIDKTGRREEAQAKAKLPVVALLGMRKDVFDQICAKAQEHGLRLDFRLYEQGTKPRPISAEWVLAMRFMGHAWEDHAKAAAGSGQFGFTNGSIPSVISQLEAWFGGTEHQQ